MERNLHEFHDDGVVAVTTAVLARAPHREHRVVRVPEHVHRPEGAMRVAVQIVGDGVLHRLIDRLPDIPIAGAPTALPVPVYLLLIRHMTREAQRLNARLTKIQTEYPVVTPTSWGMPVTYSWPSAGRVGWQLRQVLKNSGILSP